MRMVLDDPETLNEIAVHYEWFERGAFPAPGTWYDQSPVWIDMMQTVKRAHAEADVYESDRAKRREAARAEVAAGQGRRVAAGRRNGPTNT